jgi:hypothetical protein
MSDREGPGGPLGAIRRKLKALAAVARNAGATPAERETAATLKLRLQRRLDEAGAPKGDWTDGAFRLGKSVKELKKAVAPAAPKGDWTDHARGLGKVFRRGTKRFLSD